MYKTLSVEDIARELIQDENAGWSREGAYALAEHLDGDEIWNGMEFDRVEVRCTFSEYKDAVEAAVAYNWDSDYPQIAGNEANEADRESRALRYLSGLTTVILVGGGKNGFDQTENYSSIIIENF